MGIVGILFGLVVFAFPALLLAAILNIVAVRTNVWVRAVMAAAIPATMASPLWYVASSEGDPSTEERIAGTLVLVGLHFGIGLLIAFLRTRTHPVPVDEFGPDESERSVRAQVKERVRWDP